MDSQQKDELKKQIEQMQREILQMAAVARMCHEAPKDEQGNVVVSVVGIRNIGLFYQFNN